MRYTTKLPSLAEARAQEAAARASAPQRRAWYRKKRSLVLGAVAVIVIVIVGVRGNNKPGGQAGAARIDQSLQSVDAAADVTVGRLGPPGVQGLRTVDVAVTNRSSTRSEYVIELAFTSPDGSRQHDSATITFANIDPGESSTKLVSVSGKDLPSDAVVNVENVARTASKKFRERA